MDRRQKIHIPLSTALRMVAQYLWVKLSEQIWAIAFVTVYLLVFQLVVLRSAPAQAGVVAGGIAMVVFGLTLFLEGLVHGLMPLGERVGLQLPQRGGISSIVLFGVLLGLGATLAEPAIAALRTAGEQITAWEAPLLYYLLESNPGALVGAVASGVGAAVALGMMRFYFGLSLKPFILTIIPALLVLSVWFSLDDSLHGIVALAWDTGAVTTGPVTVPMVLALGIGVSRATGKSKTAGRGFGIIMLASALPVLAVLLLGAALRTVMPQPSDQVSFFAPRNRSAALRVFKTEQELARHAFQHGSPAGRQAFFGDLDTYERTLQQLRHDDRLRRSLLGNLDWEPWLQTQAAETEREIISRAESAGSDAVASAPEAATPATGWGTVLLQEGLLALRAVVPLSALLLFVLLVLLRDRLRFFDEVVFGICIALFGMTLVTSGIRLGLAPLGDDVGSRLPQVYRAEPVVQRIVIDDFDPGLVFETITPRGERMGYFYLHDNDAPRLVPFDPDRFSQKGRRYEHVEQRPALFGLELTRMGVVLVFLFAFGLGYGSTLAEPALNALGHTVEEITVGTIKGVSMIRVVSIGVGLGLVAGVARIMYGIPIMWLLTPAYLVLLPLTLWGEEEFTGVAWDSGGVTTGPVTVPLVMAMGLGIGGELGVVDGFGMASLASVFPILSVSMYGYWVRAREQRSMRKAERGDDDA